MNTKYFFIALFFITMSACQTSDSQPTKTAKTSVKKTEGKSLRNQFQLDITHYINSYNEERWENVIDMLYPPTYGNKTRDDLITNYIKGKMMGMQRSTKLHKIEKISKVVSFGKKMYCKIYYSGDVKVILSGEMLENKELLKIESNRLLSLIHKQSGSIRQHMICISYPKVYRNFAQEGYLHDYSFQYNEIAGFRASTCTPFYFYDLESESQTPLKIHPIAFTEHHLKHTKSIRKARQLMERITQHVKNAKGPLTIVLTNVILKESVFSTPWKTLFIKYLRKHGI